MDDTPPPTGRPLDDPLRQRDRGVRPGAPAGRPVIGLTTFLRAVDLAAEKVRWVAALNLVRAADAEAVPGLEAYFATLRDDPRKGVVATISPVRESTTPLYGVATTPGVIAVIDAVLAGAIAGIVVVSQAGTFATALIVAAIAFVAVLGGQFWYGNRVFERAMARESRAG